LDRTTATTRCCGRFEPFRQGDRNYALISPNYTATSVMDLQTGEIVAGEEPSPWLPVPSRHSTMFLLIRGQPVNRRAWVRSTSSSMSSPNRHNVAIPRPITTAIEPRRVPVSSSSDV
jgi:hypothetical protein